MTEKIEFYPIIAGLEKIEPIKLAKEANKSITYEKEEFSLRTCPAVRDLTQVGYVIPLWQDMLIKISRQDGVEVVPSGVMKDHDGNVFSDIQFHQEHVMAGYSFGEEYVNFSMKIRCPWYVKTKPGTSIMLLPVQYNTSPYFTIASGIIESSKYPMILAQVILKKFEGEFLLKKGTPLIQIIALKDQPQLRIHDTDAPIKKTVDIIKNWLYSKMHSVVQYRNLDKVLK
jgi:hypothetical protein